MTISITLSDEDVSLFTKYAEMHNMSLSDFIRNTVLEKIEDEYDLKCYEEAIEEYKKNPVTRTFDEVVKELGLDK